MPSIDQPKTKLIQWPVLWRLENGELQCVMGSARVVHWLEHTPDSIIYRVRVEPLH